MFRVSPASLVAAALIAASPAAAGNGQPTALGTWINPYGSVAVRTGACDGKLCGWVVWANPVAKQDARDAGVPNLIGVELLESYHQQHNAKWAGTVYVPDLGHRFSSTITSIGPNALKVQGCLIGGFLCKSQLWKRIEHLPNG